ncbi:hypothetical protein SAMN05421748_12435 [Paractinoplanes atraurantiacus]|uniref:Uncharacterized protein n=2 Tax=Paractinoplanes atraurantiacus TaxID=1036182 RepID=A0A285JRD1_9ACTN|nr:hypothetical protein SAMN05421748_12435 [Actinoplanes atraurantiacus]
MSYASAGHTGRQAMMAIMGRLADRPIRTVKLDYRGNHISLGRRDGIIQLVDGQAQPTPRHLGGRTAARIKASILGMSLWATSHPTFGLPTRTRRVAAGPAMPRRNRNRTAA